MYIIINNGIRLIIIFTAVLLLSAFLFSCKSAPMGVKNQSENMYQKDFLYLVGEIKKEHPGIPENPLQIMSENDFAELINLTYKRLESIDDDSDFYFVMANFMSRLHDGHSGIYFRPVIKKTLPVSFTWIGEDLYITRVFQDHLSYLLGREIVNIGDKKTSEFEKELNQYLHSDKENFYHLRKEFYGSNYFLMCYDTYRFFQMIENNSISFTIATEKGDQSVQLPFVDFGTLPDGFPFSMARNEITECTFQNNYKILEDISTLYFQLGTEEINKKLVLDIFQIIKDKNLENLVLDLRNSGGGCAGEDALEFFRYLIGESGHYYRYNGWRRVGDENILVTDDGTIFMDAVSKDLHYWGNVYLFTNGTTFSSSSTLTLFARDNDIGTIIGEPIGNNLIRFGDKKTIILPNTGLKAFYSTAIWGSAKKGISSEKTVEPDIVIQPTIEHYLNGEDAVWDYYLQLISVN